MAGTWQEIVRDQLDLFRERALDAVKETGANAEVVADAGRPADALLELSGHVDLLVIGSRRWGPAARALLGSTGRRASTTQAVPCWPSRGRRAEPSSPSSCQ